MMWGSRIAKVFRTLLRRSSVEREMQTEMSFHVQARADDLVAEGVAPGEAVRRARMEFGSVENYKEDCRASMGMRRWDELRADVRYTFRMLRKNPGVTAIAIITLALGIGANTAIFSIVDATVLRALPYRDPGRLVTFGRIYTREYSYNISIPNFIDLRQQGERLFENVSAFDVLTSGMNLSGAGVPQRLSSLRVSANFFQTLGIEPMLGRGFAREEDKPGNDAVVILSHRLWQDRFGSEESVIGRNLVLNGRPYTVVGVLPAGFKFVRNADVWTPLVLETTSQDRKANVIETVARLRSGVTLAEARAEIGAIGKRLQQLYPSDNDGFGVGVISFQQRTASDVRTPMLVLLGAVVLVLLVACANVANLLLAQSAGRQREIALRAALGASRGRIGRQLLTESVLLAFGGMAAGLIVARWATTALISFRPANINLVNEIKLDSRVLIFSALLALITGIAFGSAPALHAMRLDVNEALKKGGRVGNASPRRRLRSALVISEVAIALVLSVGAGLLIESFVRLLQVDPGYNPDHVLDLQLPLSDARFKTGPDLATYYRQFLPKIANLPGIQSAAVATTVPLDVSPDFPVNIEGRGLREDEMPGMIYVAVSEDFFRTLQIPLIRGRGFTEADSEHARGVAVISERTAKRWWPDGNAIGQHIWIAKSMGPQFADGGPREIVGIVGDVHNDTLRDEPRATTYVPLAQVHDGLVPLLTRLLPLNVVVRTAGEPMAAAASVQQQIWSAEPEQSVFEVRSFQHITRQSLGMERFVAWLLGSFGSLVLLLAAIGIYGVISYSVTQRANEIGVRVALGASRGRVLRMVLSDGLRLTLLGIAAGVVLALALTRIVQTLLYGVRPWEPGIYIAIAVLLSVVAILASFLPARRAMRVDPMTALRYE